MKQLEYNYVSVWSLDLVLLCLRVMAQAHPSASRSSYLPAYNTKLRFVSSLISFRNKLVLPPPIPMFLKRQIGNQLGTCTASLDVQAKCLGSQIRTESLWNALGNLQADSGIPGVFLGGSPANLALTGAHRQTRRSPANPFLTSGFRGFSNWKTEL